MQCGEEVSGGNAGQKQQWAQISAPDTLILYEHWLDGNFKATV